MEAVMISKQRRMFLFAFFLILAPSLITAQWLETTIYVPDSLCGVLNPQAFTYNTTNNKIYVGGEAGDCVIAIDGATNEKIARIPTGINVAALCWNSVNNKVYCANRNSSNVTVIDGATNSVITTVAVGSNPMAFAWNPTQNRTYVANFASSTVSVIRDSMTGIREAMNNEQRAMRLRILQNPTTTEKGIRLCAMGNGQDARLQIYDVTGKLVMEERLRDSKGEATISLGAISAGVYFVRLVSRAQTMTSKIIIVE